MPCEASIILRLVVLFACGAYVGWFFGHRQACQCDSGFTPSEFRRDLEFALRYHSSHLKLYFLREEAVLRLTEALDVEI